MQIEFDRPRELKFDLRSIKDLEREMGGMPLAEIVRQFSAVGITAITAGLYAGLKHEDTTLNIASVTKKLEAYIQKGQGIRLLARALNDALMDTGLFGKDEESEGNEQTTAAATN